MAVDAVWIMAVAAIAAVLVRTVLPYLRKKEEAEKAGEAISFKPKYFVTFIISLIGTAVTIMELLALLPIPETLAGSEMAAIAWAGFIYGWGFQSSINLFAENIGT